MKKQITNENKNWFDKRLTCGHILHWYLRPVPFVALDNELDDFTGCGTTSICWPDGVAGLWLLLRLPLAWAPWRLWCIDGEESSPPEPARPSSMLGPCWINNNTLSSPPLSQHRFAYFMSRSAFLDECSTSPRPLHLRLLFLARRAKAHEHFWHKIFENG